jgi:hypothetical protein
VSPAITHWLDRFALDREIGAHVAHVLAALPREVRGDLMDDPNFRLCDVDHRPGRGFAVTVGLPGPTGGARSVVLKRNLRGRDARFVRWLIAHELAHAYLRNEGRYPGEDPEVAADALAAGWGFPRP